MLKRSLVGPAVRDTRQQKSTRSATVHRKIRQLVISLDHESFTKVEDRNAVVIKHRHLSIDNIYFLWESVYFYFAERLAM